MTPEMTDIARRAVACKGWRWMPGMLALPSDGMVFTPVRLADEHEWPHDIGLRVPDLRDPATLGCVLALVRVAHDDECACVFPIDYGPGGVRWIARLTAGGRDMTQHVHASEAEALVAALKAAP